MNNDQSTDILLSLLTYSEVNLTVEQREAILVAIANMNLWNEVKDNLLVRSFKVSSDPNYQKGIRVALAIIDNMFNENFENLENIEEDSNSEVS